METNSTIIIISLVLTVLSGVFLKKRGTPYNIFYTTLHKLLSLTVVVFLILLAIDYNKTIGFGTLEIIIVIVGSISFVSAIGTGAYLTRDDVSTGAVLLHKVSSFLVFISMVIIGIGLYASDYLTN